ncbi:hypothetical protein CA85_33540 [Allorhodopirellula solitaria]|uniref:Transmembrane protein n=1 Tax=Allorhodopirellula solitaria TaxID=2527987 RepID=A0A5C5XQU6_9BACT|nr:hypothetical protein CA85_33540 [Allorhodopirellula solitaria]
MTARSPYETPLADDSDRPVHAYPERVVRPALTSILSSIALGFTGLCVWRAVSIVPAGSPRGHPNFPPLESFVLVLFVCPVLLLFSISLAAAAFLRHERFRWVAALLHLPFVLALIVFLAKLFF